MGGNLSSGYDDDLRDDLHVKVEPGIATKPAVNPEEQQSEIQQPPIQQPPTQQPHHCTECKQLSPDLLPPTHVEIMDVDPESEGAKILVEILGKDKSVCVVNKDGYLEIPLK